MERHSWSLKATANGSGKRRHAFLNEEDMNKGCKRVCVEPFRPLIGLDASSELSNPMRPCEARIGTMHPYSQVAETAPELTNRLDVHPPTLSKVEPSIHGSAHLLSSRGQYFGTSHSAAGVALPSIGNFPFIFPDTGFGAQTWGPGPSTPAVMNMSHHNDGEYLLAPLHPHDYQIQLRKDLEVSWSPDHYDSNTDLWPDSAASFSHQPDLSTQERPQCLPPLQSQNVGMACSPTNVKDSTVEASMEMRLSTEWPCVNNEVNRLKSESTTNVEIWSDCQTSATPESSITAMDSGKPGRSPRPNGVFSPSSNLFTELHAHDEKSDSESFVGLSAPPEYDACFGVVSHRHLISRWFGVGNLALGDDNCDVLFQKQFGHEASPSERRSLWRYAEAFLPRYEQIRRPHNLTSIEYALKGLVHSAQCNIDGTA